MVCFWERTDAHPRRWVESRRQRRLHAIRQAIRARLHPTPSQRLAKLQTPQPRPSSTADATAMNDVEKLPYTVETFDNDRDWLQARLNGTGASECSAVVNRSRFCSEYGLYVRKIERRVEDDDDLGHIDAKRMGNYLEPVIERLFIEYGDKPPAFWHLCEAKGLVLYRSKERPHVFCTPDRVYRYGAQPGVVSALELKAAYFDAFRVWKEKVPIAYLLQCQQIMYVLGIQQMWIAVLGNGLEFKWHPVARDQELLDRILPRLDRFWQRVQERDPPPIDGSKSTTDALRHVHGDGDPEKAIELDWEYAAKAEQLEAADAVAKRAQADVDKLKNEFRDALGDATTGLMPDGSRITWKTDSRGVRSLRTKRPTQKAKTA